MENDKLYNNCTGLREPDWGQYKRLELAGCTEHDGETTPDVAADKAEFFTIYGRSKAEQEWALAITDCPTALDALLVGAELSKISGLELIVDKSLSA